MRQAGASLFTAALRPHNDLAMQYFSERSPQGTHMAPQFPQELAVIESSEPIPHLATQHLSGQGRAFVSYLMSFPGILIGVHFSVYYLWLSRILSSLCSVRLQVQAGLFTTPKAWGLPIDLFTE